MVCSPKPEIVLKLDTGKLTVKDLRDDILIKALNMVNPDVMVEGKGIILISSEEGETDCNNDKILKDLKIVDGCVLKVDDFFQSYELTITLIHKDAGREDSSLFEVIADPDVIKPDTNGATATTNAAEDGGIDNTAEGDSPSPAKKPKLAEVTEGEDSDDDLFVVEDDSEDIVQTGAGSSSSNSSDTTAAASSSIRSPPKKRKPAGVEEEQGPSAKRSKTLAEQEDDDDLICIDDD